MQEGTQKSDTTHATVALLIDVDNISPKHADALFKKAASYGNIIVRRAYGQGVPNFPWPKEVILAYAIEPVMRFVSIPGKNISDIALVIGAMDLMNHKTVDKICIASDDSDFSLLAMKLRENDIKVYGFGTEKAQQSFVASCDEFNRLSVGDDKQDSELQPEPTKTTKMEEDIANIRKAIMDACNSIIGDDEGWVNLATVGQYLRRVNPAFSVKDYGYSNLTKLVDSLAEVEVKHDEKTSTGIRKKQK
ncbi:MAG: NYN domain-containing protein [Candidatus Zeuxoniibacter abyssi]|nr:MAG: NYN domain-containing protein [Candidatus Persebacteraceae bacterium AB1(2)]